MLRVSWQKHIGSSEDIFQERKETFSKIEYSTKIYKLEGSFMCSRDLNKIFLSAAVQTV